MRLAVVFPFAHAMRLALQAGGRGQAPCLNGDESCDEVPGCFSGVRHAGRVKVPTASFLVLSGAQARQEESSHSSLHPLLFCSSSDETSCSGMGSVWPAPSSKDSPSGLAASGPYRLALMGMQLLVTSFPWLSGP